MLHISPACSTETFTAQITYIRTLLLKVICSVKVCVEHAKLVVAHPQGVAYHRTDQVSLY